MSNVSFDGVDLSTLGLAVHAINGRGLAAWKAEDVELLLRDQRADMGGRHSLETTTVLSGKLSSPVTPWASHTHDNLLVNLDALKNQIDPDKGFKKLVVTGDNATIYRWARFSEMNYEEKFPVFRKPFEEIGLAFDNLEPYWRKTRSPLSQKPSAIFLPNPGRKDSRGKFTLTVTGTIPGSAVTTLFRNSRGVNLAHNPSFDSIAKYQGSNAALALDSTQAFHGTTSAKLTSSGAGNIWVGVRDTLANRVAGVAGRTYTITGYSKAGSTGRQVQGFLYFYDNADALITQHSGTSSLNATGAWTRTPALSQIAPAGTQRIGYLIHVLATGGAGEIHYVDAVQLEEATSASAFSENTDPLNVLWSNVDLLAGDQLEIDSDAETVTLIRAGRRRDVVRGYDSDRPNGFPIVAEGGSVIDAIHPLISAIQVEYDELYK